MYRYFSKISSHLPVIIIFVGSILRLLEYLYNRSVWLDEANLSLNLINKTFIQLLQPLDFGQYAPIGFLWIEKVVFYCLGSVNTP